MWSSPAALSCPGPHLKLVRAVFPCVVYKILKDLRMLDYFLSGRKCKVQYFILYLRKDVLYPTPKPVEIYNVNIFINKVGQYDILWSVKMFKLPIYDIIMESIRVKIPEVRQ